MEYSSSPCGSLFQIRGTVVGDVSSTNLYIYLGYLITKYCPSGFIKVFAVQSDKSSGCAK